MADACSLSRDNFPVRAGCNSIVEGKGIVLVKGAVVDESVEGDKEGILFEHSGDKVDKLDFFGLFLDLFLFEFLGVFVLLFDFFVLLVFFGQFPFH